MNTVLIVLFIVLAVLVAIDCLQTCTIASRPERWRERNPWLRGFIEEAETVAGKRMNVVCYFVVALALMGFVTLLLDALAGRGWAMSALGFFTLCELICTVNNHFLGIEPFDVQEF